MNHWNGYLLLIGSLGIIAIFGVMGFILFTRFSERMGTTLATELRSNREELSNKLMLVTQQLDTKISAVEAKVTERFGTFSKDGFIHFQKVQEALVAAEKQLSGLNAVGQSIHDLNQVLNLPHLRGKIIGEGNLERLLADFLPSGYYQMQYPIEGALVDAVVKFPALGLVLPIDSKFSLEQVLPLFDEAANPADLKLARKKLSELVRQNGKNIRTKYIHPSHGTTDYALMYLPSETLYFEVIRDGALWTTLTEQQVFPVSPNTLAITIHAISKSLQYYEMAKDVKKTLAKLQLAHDHFEKFRNRFEEVGDRLHQAQDAFQKAGTHLNHYGSSVDRLRSEHSQIEETKPFTV